MSTFIDSIAKQQDTWHPEMLPALDDPRWLEVFNQHSEHIKQNVVTAWFWCLYQQTVDLEELEFNVLCESVLEQQFEFLAQAHHYVNDSCRVPARYVGTAFDIKRVLRFVEETEYYYPTALDLDENEFRTLWFSSPAERLKSISKEELPIAGLYTGPWKRLLPLLLESALHLPDAMTGHSWMAKYHSFKSASLLGYEVNANTPHGLTPWLEMGKHCKYVSPATPAEKIAAFKELLTSSPPLLAVKVARLIFESTAMGTVPGVSVAHKATLLGVLTSSTTMNDFERLAELVPQCAGAWSACASMGMSLEETYAHIEQLSLNTAELALPIDFSNS